jgi:hypothetical protein
MILPLPIASINQAKANRHIKNFSDVVGIITANQQRDEEALKRQRRGLRVGGTGRQTGASPMRSAAMARSYFAELHRIDKHGFADPLLRALWFAGQDITNERFLIRVSKIWKCSRLRVVELYLMNWAKVMPYIHQEQPKQLNLAPGAPDSGELAPVEGDLPLIDVTPDAAEPSDKAP